MAFSLTKNIMFWETDSPTVFWDKEQVIFLEFQKINLCLKFLYYWKIPSYIFQSLLIKYFYAPASFSSPFFFSSLLPHTQCLLPISD